MLSQAALLSNEQACDNSGKEKQHGEVSSQLTQAPVLWAVLGNQSHDLFIYFYWNFIMS